MNSKMKKKRLTSMKNNSLFIFMRSKLKMNMS